MPRAPPPPPPPPLPPPGGVYGLRNIPARRLIDALLEEPSSEPFRVLPDPYLYADYYRVIAKPLALADMRDAAVREGARYTLTDAGRDLRRIVANAKRYNVPDSAIYAAALALERAARKAAKDLQRGGEADDDEDALCVAGAARFDRGRVCPAGEATSATPPPPSSSYAAGSAASPNVHGASRSKWTTRARPCPRL